MHGISNLALTLYGAGDYSLYSMKAKEISSFYVLKTVAAFLVVCCHVPTFMSSYHILDVAVPIFFTISGYFLYTTNSYSFTLASLVKKLKKLLLVLILLTGVYYIIDPVPFIDVSNMPIMIRWVFVSIPNRYGGPLWYLTAMIWGLIAFYAYMRFSRGRYVWAFIPLTIVGLVMGKYRFLLDGQPSSYFVFNFINYALPCFAIGYLLHKNEDKILRNSYVIDWSIMSLLLYLLEKTLLAKYSNGLSQMGPSIFMYPLCASVIALAIKYKDFGEGSFLEKIGKEYSSNIYYWHMMFVALFAYSFGEYSGYNYELPNKPYWAILVFALSLLFSRIILWIQKKLGITIFK